jgi:hypothetical protein
MINNNFSNHIPSFPEDTARDVQVLRAMDVLRNNVSLPVLIMQLLEEQTTDK